VASMGARSGSISLDDGFNPARTVEQTRKLIDEERVLRVVREPRDSDQQCDTQRSECTQDPACFPAERRESVGRPAEFPWSMGWDPPLPGRSPDLRAVSAACKSNGEDRRALSERRSGQGISEGLQGRLWVNRRPR
jgi:hypothetical protein